MSGFARLNAPSAMNVSMENSSTYAPTVVATFQNALPVPGKCWKNIRHRPNVFTNLRVALDEREFAQDL